MRRTSDNAHYLSPVSSRQCRLREGFSLIEAVISIVVVAGMFVAALTTVAASRQTEQAVESRGRAELLAHGLMSEILRQGYEEPDGSSPFGRESGEGFSSRAEWDDVDDYHRWSASPPEDKEGGPISGFDEWTRSVEVTWIHPQNLSMPVSIDLGVKRITVTVRRNDLKLAEIVAIRTEAWPVDEEGALKVLFVVTDTKTPHGQELARQTLMESWGFSVDRIAASASKVAFDAAVADADVAYVSVKIDHRRVGTKLRDAAIGVVNEKMELYDEFGFSSGRGAYGKQTKVRIADATHYITSPFGVCDLTIYSSKKDLTGPVDELAGGLRVLGTQTGRGANPVLSVLETGAQLHGGGTAAGRRVQMPWGKTRFNIGVVTADGQTIMKRSIEWAAHKEQTP